MSDRRFALSCSFAVIVGLLPAAAGANGNVSHQWVSKTAAERVPAGGSLRALVSDPGLRQALYTGTMFPDWGYTPGTTTDERDAGEASHWEPVQEGYRKWIVEHYAPPWSDEARLHLAFYLGMTSHGIADQTYDAMFFERSRFYEMKDHDAFDTDTDVMWAAATGPGEKPTLWLPKDQLLALYTEIVGKAIEAQSMQSHVNTVGGAIQAVSLIAEDPAQVAAAQADFPWAAMHHQDAATPGNPPAEAEVARRYWQSNWALVHGDPLPRPVLWTFPEDGGAEHAVQAASIEAWISIVFARGLDEPSLSASQFHVVDSLGQEAPIEIDLFYGHTSHVVHVKPTSDLIDDEVYVVTVDPGVKTIHGESLAGWSFTFSTGATGPAPVNDDAFWDVPDEHGEAAGTTGGTTGEGTGEGSGEVVTGTGDASGGTGAPGASSSSSSGDGASGTAGEGEAGGCACDTSQGRGAAGSLALWSSVIGLAGRRRRVRVRPRRPRS